MLVDAAQPKRIVSLTGHNPRVIVYAAFNDPSHLDVVTPYEEKKSMLPSLVYL